MNEKEIIHTKMEIRLSKTRETIDKLKQKSAKQKNESGLSSVPSLDDLHARQTRAEHIHN